jgi:RNA polymerase sigma-70 factor (ECF subfamily)
MDEAVDVEPNAARIVRLHAGDPDTFGELHARYAGELMAFLSARCPIRISAEDLGQSVWVKLWEKRGDFKQGDFRAWMYRIARNMLIDQCRKKYPERIAEEFDLTAPEWDQPDEWLDALRDCLQLVEGSFVEVVRDKTGGLSTEQLAKKYKISPKTVATRIHRGKQLLRECVERKVQ